MVLLSQIQSLFIRSFSLELYSISSNFAVNVASTCSRTLGSFYPTYISVEYLPKKSFIIQLARCTSHPKRWKPRSMRSRRLEPVYAPQPTQLSCVFRPFCRPSCQRSLHIRRHQIRRQSPVWHRHLWWKLLPTNHPEGRKPDRTSSRLRTLPSDGLADVNRNNYMDKHVFPIQAARLSSLLFIIADKTRTRGNI